MMHRKIGATFLAGLVALLMVVPTVATADTPSKRLKGTYSGLYHKVAAKHGTRAPGRNIRKHGIKTKTGTRDARPNELRESIAVFRRWLAPPPVAKVAIAVAPTATQSSTPVGSTGATSSTGRYTIPTDIVMCESGGNYEARNPSGAYGAYQIMPGTASAYGCDLSTHSGQDSCAAKIYAAEGRSPWVCG